MTIAKKQKAKKIVYPIMFIVFVTIITIAIVIVTRGDTSCEQTTLGGDWILFLSLGVF